MSDMTTERVEEWMEDDFLPTSRSIQPEDRIASALEYIAYHIGKIDKKLTRIQTALNK